MMRPIFPLVRGDLLPRLVKIRNVGRQLIAALRKLQLMLSPRAPVVISPGLAERERVWLRADASPDGPAKGGPRVSAVVITQRGEFYHAASEDLPEGRRVDFHGAAAVLLATRSFPEILADRRLIVGAGSAVDCYAFVKAPRKDAQAATAISLALLDMKRAGPHPFFTYITSERNIADWGPREDLRWLLDYFVAAALREPASVEEWHSPRALLRMLRAVGVDIAEEATEDSTNAKVGALPVGGAQCRWRIRLGKSPGRLPPGGGGREGAKGGPHRQWDSSERHPRSKRTRVERVKPWRECESMSDMEK